MGGGPSPIDGASDAGRRKQAVCAWPRKRAWTARSRRGGLPSEPRAPTIASRSRRRSRDLDICRGRRFEDVCSMAASKEATKTMSAEAGRDLASGPRGRGRWLVRVGFWGWVGGVGGVGCRGSRRCVGRRRVCGGIRCFGGGCWWRMWWRSLGAFLLTVELSRRSLQLTWAAVAAVPILLVCAKLTGLYDRDETLLRKTTLDEAPRLFQLATLCALVAWLTGGLLVRGALDRHEALFLWLALAGGLILARAASRALALRVAPAERCLFIGDEVSAETIRSKLTGHGGVKAEVVAHLDLDKVASWSTDSFSECVWRRSGIWRRRLMCIARSSRRVVSMGGRC